AHFCSMCGQKFCSMELTQQLRDYAKSHGLTENQAVSTGMQEKAGEFRELGGEIYTGRGGEARRGGAKAP
ncbi:MAG: hypothetical protein ACE5EO_01370, partial [Candidatus Krumholzibacteriia bacterium]